MRRVLPTLLEPAPRATVDPPRHVAVRPRLYDWQREDPAPAPIAR